MKSLPALLTFLLVVAFAPGCSSAGSPDPGESPVSAGSGESAVSGEALFEGLIDFEDRLDQPFLSPFYAGISFDGKAATSANLVVFLLDAQKRQAARAALGEVFGESLSEEIYIRIWEKEETVASEELKRTLPIFETAGSVTMIDYDELIDRLSVNINDLGDVGKIERLLSSRGMSREVVVILPGEYFIIGPEPAEQPAPRVAPSQQSGGQ